MQLTTSLRRALPMPARLALKRLVHAGGARTCVICGARVRAFLPQGYGYELLEQLEVVGGMRRLDDECPVCRSNDRTRLIHLYTRYHSMLYQQRSTLLHIAPELGLAARWSAVPQLHYIPADLDRQRYRHLPNLISFDVQRSPFADETFDWIVCNHVLEHVADDLKAMREIHRMLKRGGTALLQVPIAMKRWRTDEDPDLSDEAERIRRFGQRDHVRLYGLDYYDRLAACGFEVELWDAFAADPERARIWQLNPRERLTLARRSG